MAKQRTHNEHFRIVLLGGRKSCPVCKCKLEPDENIWSWGEYHNVRWNTVRYLCKNCWEDVRTHFIAHTGGCGCKVELIVHATHHPEWLGLDTVCDVVSK